PEVLFLEAVHELAAVVDHRGVQDHQVHVHLDAAPLLALLPGRGRLGLRKVDGVVLSARGGGREKGRQDQEQGGSQEKNGSRPAERSASGSGRSSRSWRTR